MEVTRIADNVISPTLCIAARNGQKNAVRKLLDKGHNVNLNDNRGWTPLHEASAHGHIDCVKLLLQHEECNVSVLTYEGMSPVYLACQYQNDVELIKLLIQHGVSCNAGNTENVTPLHIASKMCKLELVKELVKQGANVNVQDFNGFTPLMEAIEQVTNISLARRLCLLEAIRVLLDGGANVSISDLYGRTALFIATCVKWKDCIELLLEYGSDINARTRFGDTAIVIAAQTGNLQLVKFLLAHGASSDIVSKCGTVPLHHALHNGYISVAEELIAKMNFKDIRGNKKRKLESFLILAIDSSSFESFRLVMDNNLFSHEDHASFSIEESNVTLSEICFRHYLFQTPISFLLSNHIEGPSLMPMLQCLLDSDFSVNVINEHFLPPLVALIAGSQRSTNIIHISKVTEECFLKLLQKGADIDYNSGKNCPGSLQIPDAVMAVITNTKCSVQQSLLLPVLAHCFACDWDDLLDWLVKYHICSAAVLDVLIQLSTRTKQSFSQIWMSVKQCKCDICKKEFPNIKKLMSEKESTLQSLSRAKVRLHLWKKCKKSSEAERILQKMHVPLPVRQYIVPGKV